MFRNGRCNNQRPRGRNRTAGAFFNDIKIPSSAGKYGGRTLLAVAATVIVNDLKHPNSLIRKILPYLLPKKQIFNKNDNKEIKAKWTEIKEKSAE